MIKSDSWTVLDNKHAIKKTDPSFYLHHGSGIPADIFPFFDLNPKDELEGREIVVAFEGTAYPARFRWLTNAGIRAQIQWRVKLQNALMKYYPGDEVDKSQYPDIHVYRVNEDSYIFSFTDNIEVEGEDNFELEVQSVGKEGKVIHIYTTKYERNPALRKAAIEYHGLKCFVCGFEFEKKYGEWGKGYIEVHHKEPLFLKGEEKIVDSKTDLVCLCSNCHRMVHRKKDSVLPVEKLKDIVEEQDKKLAN